MISASLDMLEDSLRKKIDILCEIEKQNEKQKLVLTEPEQVDEEAFDKTVEIKGELIERINSLDDGFQSLFDRVKGDIGQNKELYADQIKRIQELIRNITGKSASIEAEEHRNKRLAEKYFSTARGRISQNKQSSSAAFNYYQTMNNFKNIPPQFYDTKN